MRISYLPIFLALASSTNPRCTAQHIRAVRQTLLGPLLELNIAGLLTSVLSMVMPSGVSEVLSQNIEDVFSKVPLDLSVVGRLASLDVLKGLGRKKRSMNYLHGETKPKTIETFNSAESSPLVEKSNGLHAPREVKSYFMRNVRSLIEHDSTSFLVNAPIHHTHTRKPIERKRRSNDEEGASVQSKAMETGMRGAGMAQKGLESGKKAAEAGSDMAQSGKAGAEGLASGADMMGGAAETMAAGAGQVQSMIPG